MLKLAGELFEGRLADHEARLDAHTRNIYQILRTGEYSSLPMHGIGAPIALTANRLYAIPYIAVRDITIDRLAICVTTADSGKSVRMGVHHDDGTNLYPGSLIKDAGTASVGTTGVKAVIISPALALSKGLWFLTLVSDGAPSLRDARLGMSPLGIRSTDFAATYGFWYVSFTYAALPDPFTAGGSLGGNAPLICPRVASLA